MKLRAHGFELAARPVDRFREAVLLVFDAAPFLFHHDLRCGAPGKPCRRRVPGEAATPDNTFGSSLRATRHRLRDLCDRRRRRRGRRRVAFIAQALRDQLAELFDRFFRVGSFRDQHDLVAAAYLQRP